MILLHFRERCRSKMQFCSP